MTELKITRDKKGLVAYGVNFSDTGSIVSMLASTNDSLAVPAGADFALFQFTPGATVLVGTGSVSIPVPGIAFTSASEDINPEGRSLYNVSTLQFYAETASLVKVSFYKVNA